MAKKSEAKPSIDIVKQNEMMGFAGLKMMGEALEIARYFLLKPRINPTTFTNVLHILSNLESTPKTWQSLVESAYSKLGKLGRNQNQFGMLYYSFLCGDYNGVIRHAPPKIDKSIGAGELQIIWDAWLALGKWDELTAVVPVISHAIETAYDCSSSRKLAASYLKYWGKMAELELKTEQNESALGENFAPMDDNNIVRWMNQGS